MEFGKNLVDKDVIWPMFDPATPSTSTARWLNCKSVELIEIEIEGVNTSGTVTGSAITLTQAQDTSGTNSKALSFSRYYTNLDPANSTVMTNATAVSNTFTTSTTASKPFSYRIPIDPSWLDTYNGFNYLGVSLATGVNTTISVRAHVVPAYRGNASTMPNLSVN